jgi:hypothetical protein
MDLTSTPAADLVPSTADLELIMEMLGTPGDPVYIMKDHPDPRQRAELLARVSAGIVDSLGRAEVLADLDLEDRAQLHWDADCDVAALRGRSPNDAKLLDLQLARLAWVHHAIVRGRGPRPCQIADTVGTAVGAVIQLIEVWRAGRFGEHVRAGQRSEDLEPMLGDALLMLRDAADQLARVLRTGPPRRSASTTRVVGGPTTRATGGDPGVAAAGVPATGRS